MTNLTTEDSIKYHEIINKARHKNIEVMITPFLNISDPVYSVNDPKCNFIFLGVSDGKKPKRFKYMEKFMEYILTHESLHVVIHRFDSEASEKMDNLDDPKKRFFEVTESD